MGEVLFATQNPIKLEEARHILGEVRAVDWPMTEVQEIDPRIVAEQKLDQITHRLQRDDIVLVEDTGLALDAWDGLPGALVKSFVSRLGVDKFAAIVPPGAAATAISAVAVATSTQRACWSGSLRGTIVSPRGHLGGWTPIFEIGGTGRTLAELPLTERLAVTMRRRPLEQVKAWIGTR